MPAASDGTDSATDTEDPKPGLVGRLVPNALRRRYVTKFVVAFAVVVVLIAGVGAMGYAQTQEQVSESTENRLTSTAKLHGGSMTEWVTGMETQTVLLSGADEVQNGAPDEIGSYIDTRLQELSLGVQSVHYVNVTNGTVEASTQFGYDGRPLSNVSGPWGDESFYEGVSRIDSVTMADQSYHSENLDGQVLAFASPVLGKEGGYVVIVGLIEYKVDSLYQPVRGGETVILNGDGERVVGNGSAAAFQSIETDGNASTAGFSQDGDTVRAYTEVQGTDWTVVTSAPTSQAFAVRNAVGRNVVIIVAVALIGLAVAGVFLGRHTVSPIRRLQAKAAAMEEGDLDVDLRTARNDEIGQLFHGFASMRDSLSEQIREAKAARSAAEDARAEAEALNDHLEEKAAHYSEVMRAVGEGDLTREMNPRSESEAMTDIAQEFNRMIENLAATTERVKGFARTVAASSSEVTASAEEVRNASEQVTESIQEISDGAETQHDELQSVADEMNTLSTTIEEIAASTSEVADIAARTAEAGENGQEDAAAAIEGMEAIQSDSREAVEEIRDLETSVTQIDELVDAIEEIADQTNMLALNANIEASRSADENQEGFGVVAAEIKELSQKTIEATESIENRLVDIQSQTESTASVVRRTQERVSQSTDSVREAAEDLERIADYAHQTDEGISEITEATRQQATSTEEVVTMIDEATAISERTSEESEHVAAAAEEQTSALSEVASSVTDLADRANRLSDTLSQFETPGSEPNPGQGSPVSTD